MVDSGGWGPCPAGPRHRTAIKPWQHRSWLFPRDPRFAVKASRVLDLYQREREGKPLGEDEYVLSADEKPGVQARIRIHLPLPPGPGRPVRADSWICADTDVAARMKEAGLSATICVPAVHMVLPSQIDPPGAPQDIPTHPAGPLEVVTDALPGLADVAADCGVTIGVELLAARRGSVISSLPRLVALLDEIGRDNLGIMFSVYHSWSEPNLHEDLLRYGTRINKYTHVFLAIPHGTGRGLRAATPRSSDHHHLYGDGRRDHDRPC